MNEVLQDREPTASWRAINPWAVLIVAAANLVASSVYYTVFAGVWLSLRGLDPATARARPGLGEIAGQYVRNVVAAAAFAYLLSLVGTRTVGGAVRLGLLVWLGFQAATIFGSVLHEHYPIGLYLLHVGDALMTTLILALILGAWRRRKA